MRGRREARRAVIGDGLGRFREPEQAAQHAMRSQVGDDQRDAFRRDYWPHHPLSLERMSHVTLLVHDVDAATAFYRDVLDGVVLPETAATLEGTEASYLLVGEDTVVELARPRDATSELAGELQQVGQGAVAATFKVRDLAAAEEHLRMFEAPIAAVTADWIRSRLPAMVIGRRARGRALSSSTSSTAHQ